MNKRTLQGWKGLVNTREGSPVTDATLEEIEEAMNLYAWEVSYEHQRDFLRRGGKWRELLETEDILGLTLFVLEVRRRRKVENEWTEEHRIVDLGGNYWSRSKLRAALVRECLGLKLGKDHTARALGRVDDAKWIRGRAGCIPSYILMEAIETTY